MACLICLQAIPPMLCWSLTVWFRATCFRADRLLWFITTLSHLWLPILTSLHWLLTLQISRSWVMTSHEALIEMNTHRCGWSEIYCLVSFLSVVNKKDNRNQIYEWTSSFQPLSLSCCVCMFPAWGCGLVHWSIYSWLYFHLSIQGSLRCFLLNFTPARLSCSEHPNKYTTTTSLI